MRWKFWQRGDGRPAADEGSPEWQRQVTERAFQIYVTGGRTDGHALEDWLQAQAELRSPPTRSPWYRVIAPLVVLGVVAPPMGAGATIAFRLYMAQWVAVLLGLAVAALTAVVVAVLIALYTTADRCNGRQYGELISGLRFVQAYLRGASFASLGARTAWDAACSHTAAVEDALRTKSLLWLSSDGYVNAWSELHRAEELLMMFADEANVTGWALEDQLRLTGSGIPQADQLRELSRFCVTSLGATTSAAQPATATGGLDQPKEAWAARADLMEVRFAVNSYRDGIWQKLVNAKNLLLTKVAAGWVLTYLFTIVLVLIVQDRARLQSITVFFLVGVVVGMISDVSQQSLAESAEEDYGLSRNRLLATMLLSGAAAVLGVALTAILGVTVLGQPLAGTVSAARGSALPSSWAQVFDWHMNFTGFVAAAAFGFAPTRLFDLLRTDQANAVQKIQSSNSAPSS